MEVIKEMTTSIFYSKEDEEWGFFVPLDEPINRVDDVRGNQISTNYHLSRYNKKNSELDNAPVVLYCMLNILYAVNYVINIFKKK